LKDHLLARIRGIQYTGDELEFSNEQRDELIFANNKLYEHSVFRINYTTYDLRREQDSLNPRTRSDIMVLSHETGDARHPYWYARIIRIFHVDIWDSTDELMFKPRRMDFLFVRWFGRDSDYKSGWSAKRLHRVGFLRGDDPDAFGFLDPDVVIRGVHLIPAFGHGQTDNHLETFAQADSDNDWLYFYVNM